jgi:hypothetical protein
MAAPHLPAGPETVWQGPAEPSSAPRDRARGVVRRDAAVVLGTLLALGVLGGVLWWLLTDPAEFTRLQEGGSMTEVELGQRFSADGTYAVVALVLGLLAGTGLSWWRSRDPLLTSGLLLGGAVLAAAMMWLVGHLLGPGDTRAALQAAAVGTKVPEPLGVDVWTVFLAWPVAVLGGALVVLLGRGPGVDADADG